MANNSNNKNRAKGQQVANIFIGCNILTSTGDTNNVLVSTKDCNINPDNSTIWGGQRIDSLKLDYSTTLLIARLIKRIEELEGTTDHQILPDKQ